MLPQLGLALRAGGIRMRSIDWLVVGEEGVVRMCAARSARPPPAPPASSRRWHRSSLPLDDARARILPMIEQQLFALGVVIHSLLTAATATRHQFLTVNQFQTYRTGPDYRQDSKVKKQEVRRRA